MSQTHETLSEFAPTSAQELSRFLRENFEGPAQTIFPVGGRTALQYLRMNGQSGTMVSTQYLNQTVDYPARDMTITVGAGMRVSDLNSVLAKEQQELPLDISHQTRATIGGAIACNVSGPRRYGQGTFRDFLIGMTAVDPEGRLFRAGGRVVKNVAGYDLCKLMIGARGTLGVLAEVTLKVKPKPAHREAIWINCDSFATLDKLAERLLTSATRPVVMDAFTPTACHDIAADARITFPADSPVLLLAYEGSEHEIMWQIGTLRTELRELGEFSVEEVGDDASNLLLATLREYSDGGDVPCTFQANLLPSRVAAFLERCREKQISAVARMGNGIVVGHLSDDLGPDSQKSLIRELTSLAREQGGNLIILNADKMIASDLDWWGQPEASWSVMKTIKHSLDSKQLFNPGATPFE